MNTNEEIKEMVKQKYSEIALQDQATNDSSCCGSGGCSTEVYNIMSDEYDHLDGILYVDKVSPVSKRLISKKLKNLEKNR